MASMSTGTLHFFSGRIASGKTTAARQTASNSNAVMVCEDEWLVRLFEGAATFEQYLERRRRIRFILEIQVPQILAAGASVVFDFAGNTPKDRAWVKSLASAAGAPHLLHVLEADEPTCRQRLKLRNETQPSGIYWGPVSEQLFDQVNAHFLAPQPDEGLTMVVEA
jgi:predicted kinase